MSPNPLDPAALTSLLPTLLPQLDKVLKNSHDALTSLIHATMSALGFRLTAVDESPSSLYENNVLPVEWNKSGPGHYVLKYRHEQSSLEFVIKVSRLGSRTLINAIALETDKIATLDIATNDFSSPSFFPHTIDSANAQPLIHGFISSNRVSDLISQFKLKILQKIIPGLRKEGYEDVEETTESSTRPLPDMQPGPPGGRPSRAPPPPEAPRNPFHPQPMFPHNPLEVGRRDLDPFPMNPFSPPSLFPPGQSGDGMFVGPDHPIFGVPRGGIPGRGGPWGGDGYLPPMGAPPGARFDPIGPEPYPRRSGPPGTLGSGRGRHPPTSGEPDNDEFMPPGASDMFM